MCEIAACALIMLHGKNDLTKGPEMHFFFLCTCTSKPNKSLNPLKLPQSISFSPAEDNKRGMFILRKEKDFSVFNL